jgi:hypothetical protein
MRLILTKVGNEVMQGLRQEFSESRSRKNSESSIRSNYENTYETLPSQPSFDKIKLIEVNKKFQVPTNIANAYNYRKDSESNMLNTIIHTSNLNKTPSLKNILKSETVKDLKHQITAEAKLPKLFNNIIQYRTHKDNNRMLTEIDDLMNKSLDKSATNLITYISNKDNITPMLVKKITQADKPRLINLNKACLKLKENDEKVKDLKIIIRENIKSQRERKVAGYQDDLKELSNSIRKIKETMRHKYKDSRRINVEFIHREFTNEFWNHKIIKLHDPKYNLHTEGNGSDYYNIRSIKHINKPK